MPCSPHPLALKIEQQLQTLRAWEADDDHQTPENLCRGLNALTNLCRLVDALLQLPPTQQSLFQHRHHKCADEALEGCLRMLDVCLLFCDLLAEMKENAQALQSSLRRCHGLANNKLLLRSYLSSKKKMRKAIEKSLRESRKTEKQQQYYLFGGDIGVNQRLGGIFYMLREVRWVTNSVLGSILSLVSSDSSRARKSRSFAGRCLVAGKWMGKQRVACQGREVKLMGEAERVDAALFALLWGDKKKMVWEEEDLGWTRRCVRNAEMELERWECSIESVKEILDCVFPCLIKMRVSLLNSFNH